MVKIKNDRQRLSALRTLIAYHREKYHTEDAPEISDEAYDALLTELRHLEMLLEGTEVVSSVIGGTVNAAFTKVHHQVRQWSFDNAFSLEELKEWEARVLRNLVDADMQNIHPTYVAEHKIDGLKLIVHYKNGRLVQAVTRGDGEVGEDVTHTASTIALLPHQLTALVDLICVGEVWLGKKEFLRVNEERSKAGESLFANPRNAAAGSLRQLDPAISRSRALSFFAYDIDLFDSLSTNISQPKTQIQELILLQKLGLPTNKYSKHCTTLDEVEDFYRTWVKKREALPFGIDGVVVKVDEIVIQKALGYTAKAPRFGIAYKFPAVQTTTVVEDIQLQVGRTGVVTPVAHLRPVLIDGSTVARATLHNADQIARLDVRIGDTVVLQKAGDVIPEVVMVLKELRPENTKPYKFPKKVPDCGADGTIVRLDGEVAHRCVSIDSPAIHQLRLHYFASKAAFNIDGIGPKVIDALLAAELISIPADLFNLTEEDFLTLPGFKAKSASNAVEAIKKAKTQTLTTVLVALSIDQVGEETARLLAGQYESLAEIAGAAEEDLIAIHGIGEIVAHEVVVWFASKENQRELDALLTHIEVIPEKRVSNATALSGKRLVITGTLSLPRDEVKKQIRQAGGTVVGSVSKKTDYVLAGSDPGSKVEMARTLGVPIITEEEFSQLLS